MRKNAPYSYEKNQSILRRAREHPCTHPSMPPAWIWKQKSSGNCPYGLSDPLIVENQNFLNLMRMKHDLLGA
jgi:hypothetical protein